MHGTMLLACRLVKGGEFVCLKTESAANPLSQIVRPWPLPSHAASSNIAP
jgi:hypothetical protein